MNEMDSSTNTADTNNKKHADNYDDDDDDDDGMVPVTRWALLRYNRCPSHQEACLRRRQHRPSLVQAFPCQTMLLAAPPLKLPRRQFFCGTSEDGSCLLGHFLLLLILHVSSQEIKAGGEIGERGK